MGDPGRFARGSHAPGHPSPGVGGAVAVRVEHRDGCALASEAVEAGVNGSSARIRWQPAQASPGGVVSHRDECRAWPDGQGRVPVVRDGWYGNDQAMTGSVAATTPSMTGGAMNMPIPAATPKAKPMMLPRAAPAIRPMMMNTTATTRPR